jgi:hypothetical protein
MTTRILETMRQTAKGLCDAGLMDTRLMQELNPVVISKRLFQLPQMTSRTFQLDFWCKYGAITHHPDLLEDMSCRDKASP